LSLDNLSPKEALKNLIPARGNWKHGKDTNICAAAIITKDDDDPKKQIRMKPTYEQYQRAGEAQ